MDSAPGLSALRKPGCLPGSRRFSGRQSPCRLLFAPAAKRSRRSSSPQQRHRAAGVLPLLPRGGATRDRPKRVQRGADRCWGRSSPVCRRSRHSPRRSKDRRLPQMQQPRPKPHGPPPHPAVDDSGAAAIPRGACMAEQPSRRYGGPRRRRAKDPADGAAGRPIQSDTFPVADTSGQPGRDALRSPTSFEPSLRRSRRWRGSYGDSPIVHRSHRR
jgi:hypothetical protein